MTVKEKQNVTLPCKATGFPPPVITWYKDDHVMEEKRRHYKKRNLEIKNILYEDHGIYTCRAENLLGRIQLSVNVTVTGKYSIQINNLISFWSFYLETSDLIFFQHHFKKEKGKLEELSPSCIWNKGNQVDFKFHILTIAFLVYNTTKRELKVPLKSNSRYPFFLHFRTQEVFSKHFAKFQAITNIRTHVF